MKTVDMSLSPAESKEEAGTMLCCDEKPKGPEYPYGLCLYLDKLTLEKLGITDRPALGTEFTIVARAKVKGSSESESEYEGGEKREHKTVDLQITAMGMEAAASDSFYDKSAMAKD